MCSSLTLHHACRIQPPFLCTPHSLRDPTVQVKDTLASCLLSALSLKLLCIPAKEPPLSSSRCDLALSERSRRVQGCSLSWPRFRQSFLVSFTDLEVWEPEVMGFVGAESPPHPRPTPVSNHWMTAAGYQGGRKTSEGNSPPHCGLSVAATCPAL